MLMNVQLYRLGDRGVKLCARFLNCRNTDLFNTCTSMTWTQSTTYTQRLNKRHILHTNINLDLYISTIPLFLVLLPFIFYSGYCYCYFCFISTSVLWRSSQTASDIRETFTGRLLVNIRPVSARPQITPEEWTVWLRSMMTEVSL